MPATLYGWAGRGRACRLLPERFYELRNPSAIPFAIDNDSDVTVQRGGVVSADFCPATPSMEAPAQNQRWRSVGAKAPTKIA